MGRDDFYASPFGVAYSFYIERPRLARLVSRVVWGGDPSRYYASMAAIDELPDGGTVVDCPCGAGPVLRRLEPGRAVRYFGVDRSPAMLRRSRARAAARGLSELELVEADASAIPLADGAADLYLSLWGLHCFDDPAAAMVEAGRILRPGGRLVGCCFVRGDSLRQRLLLRPHSGDFGPLGSEADVRNWLAAAGLELTGVERSGLFMFFEARARAPGG